MRTMKAILLFGIFTAFGWATAALGYYSYQEGHERGMAAEFAQWQETLIVWGCMGYEAKTGDIVFTGASCKPATLAELEPAQ